VNVDVAVVGAGPAGSATARRLALSGLRVALLEQSRLEFPRVGESLAPAVQPELLELGVWTLFKSLRPLASHGTRSCWGDAAPRVHSHVMNPWGSGWHVDRPALDQLLAKAAADAGAELVVETKVVSCRRSGGGWALTLNRHASRRSRDTREWSVRARVVVDATGRSATIATRLGAGRMVFDKLVGVASLMDGLEVAHQGFVMVEAVSDGWWYSAPVPSRGLMVMMMTDGDVCGRSRIATMTGWARELAATAQTGVRSRPGRTAWGPRVFSAVSQRLVRAEWQRPWLAVGDAALAVDPISGSGVLRALRSARAAAATAAALVERDDPEAIATYETQCDRACMAYLNERAMYYRLETRWPSAAFWSRRHSPMT
jgi:flavin-dependent dehydrogenase